MAGIGIIANPHSKLNRRNPENHKLLAYIVGQKGFLEITQTLDDLSEAIASFQKKEIEILAINGGDGTISRTLTALIRCYGENPLPKIALLRGGTMNMLADNLGIYGSPQEILMKLMESHAAHVEWMIKKQSSLNIMNMYGFLFASGTSARFLDVFYRNKTGRMGVFFLVFRIICSLLFSRQKSSVVKRDLLQVSFSRGGSFSGLFLTFFISTVKKLPMGIPYFFDVPKLHHLEWSGLLLDEKEIAYKLPFVAFWRNKKKSFEISGLSCDSLFLKGEDKLDFTLDGELYKVDPGIALEVCLGPDFEFIVI